MIKRRPDSELGPCSGSTLPRREFLQVLSTSVAAGVAPRLLAAEESGSGTAAKKPSSENLVRRLYDSLSDTQKASVCFSWEHRDERGTLRSHVSNNWNITERMVASPFYTADQQDMIEAIFWNLYAPEWHDRIRKQLRDDAGGYGKRQSIAIFGKPGADRFEFVMTGRHLTVRCDGNSTDHSAFGGPIFYGHAAQGFNEKPDHPGNVFWPQALQANRLYQMLDGKQRKLALVQAAPAEEEVHFQGPNGKFQGIPVSEFSTDQRDQLRRVMALLVEPYRQVDRQEATACLDKQGGLDACHIAFYRSDDVGQDGVWDTWRLEGPSFVWHFRGDPHVHVWVNVADSPDVSISTAG